MFTVAASTEHRLRGWKMAIPPEVDGTVRLVRRERPRADGPLIDGAKALFPSTTAVDRGALTSR
jgi:hypothetical protein